MPTKCKAVYCPLLYPKMPMQAQSQVPLVGPTYIYGEKKEKKTERGELLRSTGKYTNKPKTPV